jgi:hypothetical protein
MIVDMEASIEISKPVAAIFAAKMLVARAAAHAHEPGSGDESSTVTTRTYFYRVRVNFCARLANTRLEERGKGREFQCFQ